MSGQYIIVRSITYAYKGSEILGRKNIRTTIEKAPASISSCGCNYALRLGDSANIERAVRILRSENVEVLSYGQA